MLGTFREIWFGQATSTPTTSLARSNENLAFTVGRVLLSSRGDGLEQLATSIVVDAQIGFDHHAGDANVGWSPSFLLPAPTRDNVPLV